MQSSISSVSEGPLTFHLVRVREPSPFAFEKDAPTLYARFMIWKTETFEDPRQWDGPKLGITARVEGSTKSWLTDGDRIGHTLQLGEVVGVVEVDVLAAEEGMDMAEALSFGCKHLNPVLENMAVLVGIGTGLDIEICHTLRPTPNMLVNLYAKNPKWRKKSYPFPTK